MWLEAMYFGGGERHLHTEVSRDWATPVIGVKLVS